MVLISRQMDVLRQTPQFAGECRVAQADERSVRLVELIRTASETDERMIEEPLANTR